MPNNYKSLNQVIEEDSAFSKFRKAVSEHDVVIEFNDIFPNLKKTVIAQNVNKGILYLTVENSVLRNEMFLKKEIVVKKINTHFNKNIISDIKFTNFRNINRKNRD